MEDLFQVGIITSPHGVRGEVKVFPTTDDVNRFKKLKHVILEPETKNQELNIESVKFYKNMVILKFKEITSMDEAEKYRKMGLYVTRENAVKLNKDEYFIADLMGLQVIDEDGSILGNITDVLQTGANDVYVVNDGTREVLIPAIKACILQVDISARTMKVHLLEGLLD